MSVSDIPQEWRDILADIQQSAPGAVIAGGALRDLRNDRPVKDLDIFIPKREWSTHSLFIHHSLERRGFHLLTNYRIHYGLMEEVQSLEFISRDKHCVPLNIIIDPAEKLDTEWIHRFDFGASMISFDGKVLHVTERFLRDCALKRFTYFRNKGVEDIERSRHRAHRIGKKYPGWHFIFPAEEEGFY